MHAVGDDYANVPPAMALGRRGIVDNLHGYSIYGDYSKAAPARALIDAVAAATSMWRSPGARFAGYFAGKENIRWRSGRSRAKAGPGPADGFRDVDGGAQDDTALRTVWIFHRRRHDAIDAVLDRYGIPVVAGRCDAPREALTCHVLRRGFAGRGLPLVMLCSPGCQQPTGAGPHQATPYGFL